MCLVFKISAYPFGQVKTKMYLPESPFFKKSLAGASGLVLMSVPALLLFDSLAYVMISIAWNVFW